MTVTLNGALLGSFSYNGAVADGGLGTISRTGTTSFDDVHVVIGSHVSNLPDSQPPVLTVPANLTRPTDPGKATAFISDSTLGTATATDNVGIVSLVRIGRAGREHLPARRHDDHVDRDRHLRQPDRRTQFVTVVDTQKPVLVVPPNVSRQIPSTATSITITDAELGTATATDNSGSVTIVRTGVPAGNVFLVGTTTITYTATDPSGNTTTSTQTVTVTRAAPLPSLSIADVSISEGNKGTKTVTLTVTLSAASSSAVTVAYATGGGTATAGADYQAKSGTLTFAAGVRTQTFTITIVGDTLKEPDETILVTLSNAANATIARAVATVTIVDDEKALTVSQTAPEGHEASALTSAELESAVGVATAQWLAFDPDANFSGVRFVISDLADNLLGLTNELTITIDATAAGWGWTARPGGAPGRVDLVTVVVHELGHALGLDHDEDGLMAAELAASETRTLVMGPVDFQRIRAPAPGRIEGRSRPELISAPAKRQLRAPRVRTARAGTHRPLR